MNKSNIAIINELKTAKTIEAQAAVVAEHSLRNLPLEMARIVRLCVIPSWFDKELLEELVPNDAQFTADEIYSRLQMLPFIETLPWGLSFHKSTREGLLELYSSSQKDFISKSAIEIAPIFEKRKGDKKSLAEAYFCYSLGRDIKAVKFIDNVHQEIIRPKKEATKKYDYDVFIIYNHQNSEWVKNFLLPRLELANLRVGIDFRDFVPGSSSVQSITDTLIKSKKVILVLSKDFSKSDWSIYEDLLARIKSPTRVKNQLVPIRLDKSKLPPFLVSFTWIDFSRPKYEENSWRKLGNILGVELIKRHSQGWFLPHPYGIPPNFTGRKNERKILTDWLLNDKSHPLFILRALGGTGKSSLCWQWLNNDIDKTQWKKVVWWSFYEGDASFENFLIDTLKYLGSNTENLTQRQQIDRLLHHFNDPGILIVLDGFERTLRAYSSFSAGYQSDELGEVNAQNASRNSTSLLADMFLKLLCEANNHIQSKVLITSRLTPSVVEKFGQLLPGCIELELTGLHKQDAVTLFRKLGVKGSNVEIESACASYAYHPLSLRLLASLILKDPNNPGDISVARKINLTENIIHNKHHVIQQAFGILPAQEKYLLSIIACFRSSVNYETIEAVTLGSTGKSKNKVRDVNELNIYLADLVSLGLLHLDLYTNSYDLHPIVRHYAYNRLTDAGRIGTHERLVSYFEATPQPERVEKLEDLAPVIELYHHMVRAGNLDDAFLLLYQRLAEVLFYNFGAYNLYAELLLALFPNDERNLPDLSRDDAKAFTINALANAYALNGQPNRAARLFLLGNNLDDKRGNKKGIAIGLGNLATQQFAIGRLHDAERSLRHSIDLCREMDERLQESNGHHELSRVLAYCGQWQESENEHVTSLMMFEREQHIQGQSMSWAYHALNCLQRTRDKSDVKAQMTNIIYFQFAIEYAHRALKLANEQTTGIPVPRNYIRASWLLGAAHRANNELTLAEESLSKALNLCRQINMVDHEADILLDLARLRYAVGDFKDAQEKASEALMITERSGYVLQGADVNLFLAQYALEQEKDEVKAKEYAESALRLAYCDGPPYYYKVAYEEAVAMLERLKV